MHGLFLGGNSTSAGRNWVRERIQEALPSTWYVRPGEADGPDGFSIQVGFNEKAGSQEHAINILDAEDLAQGAITFSEGAVSFGPLTAYYDVTLPEADNAAGYPYGTLVEVTGTTQKMKADGVTPYTRGFVFSVRKSSGTYSRDLLGIYSRKYTPIPAIEAKAAEQYEMITEKTVMVTEPFSEEQVVWDADQGRYVQQIVSGTRDVPQIEYVDQPIYDSDGNQVATESMPVMTTEYQIKSDAVEARPALHENLHQINFLGPGHVLCNGESGNIQPGDGITSSATDGEGMKADQVCMIAAIAREAVTFSGSESKLVAVEYVRMQFTPWA